MVKKLKRQPRQSVRPISYRRRVANRRWLAFGTMAVLLSARLASAEPDAALRQRIGAGDPIAGKQKSAEERCQECHGEDGNNTDLRIPKHAGQLAGYLSKQLRDFQSGSRKHEVMTTMAADLSAQDIADIAAYFASQKVMNGQGGPEKPLAKTLFTQGDAVRELPSCVSCHGSEGKGNFADNTFYPAITGQNRLYLRQQLVNWKMGERKNSAEGVMNRVANLLSDQEIDELVEYLAGR